MGNPRGRPGLHCLYPRALLAELVELRELVANRSAGNLLTWTSLILLREAEHRTTSQAL